MTCPMESWIGSGMAAAESLFKFFVVTGET
jgi:hypothetical protein